ncbi:uncharacterized protein LOC142224377 [Haematobia irritans]|uniref:uncharacterized protein LOC142224377 n=1 Tax=Haematobia irritans TaxID=7368 RepID=UPI003F4FB784
MKRVQSHNQPKDVATTSKTKLLKNPSEISLTPSQAAEHAKATNRKNPLDALSKPKMGHVIMEKRSGLQDVNEEYLKQNVFRTPAFQKRSNQNESHQSSNNMTSIQEPQQQNHQQFQHHPNTEEHLSQPILSGTTNQTPSHFNAAQIRSSDGTGSKLTDEQLNCSVQGNHNQHHPVYQHSIPEPKMCTTCPNCQTTIYLMPVQTFGQIQQIPNQVPCNESVQQNSSHESGDQNKIQN